MSKSKVRWIVPNDYAEIERIERASFKMPWTRLELHQYLRSPTVSALVACIDEQVVGYASCNTGRDFLHLDSVAVLPEFQRTGIGSNLIDSIVKFTSEEKYRSIFTTVREKNLPAHLLLRENGFKCVRIARNVFASLGEDAYVFRKELKEVEPRGPRPMPPENA